MERLYRAEILGIIVLGMALAGSVATGAGVTVFGTGSDQISSFRVLDITEDMGGNGNLYFGTENGLSVYDGEGGWQITHAVYSGRDQSLLSDHVLAVEFDHEGTLWIGYPNGLQKLSGGSYSTIQDQQLLKSLEVHELLRRGREMWVATGNSGIHRYLDGSWKWYRPGGPEGFGCVYVNSMATDPSTGTLYVVCKEGIWSTGRSGSFSPFSPAGGIPGPVTGARSDPFGGMYLFNSTAVFHYTQGDRMAAVLTPEDLILGIAFSDIAVGPDHSLWVATNQGIYQWDGGVKTRVNATTGIVSNAVEKIYLDAEQRLWFVTPESVGYFPAAGTPAGGDTPLSFTVYDLPAPETSVNDAAMPSAQITPIVSVEGFTPQTPAPRPGPLGGFLDPILNFFRGLFQR